MWQAGKLTFTPSMIRVMAKILTGHNVRMENDSAPSMGAKEDYESEVAQSCPTLCDPMNCSLPRSSTHGIFQARILEQVAISFSRGSSQPRDWTRISHIAGRPFTLGGWKYFPHKQETVILRKAFLPGRTPRDLAWFQYIFLFQYVLHISIELLVS